MLFVCMERRPPTKKYYESILVCSSVVLKKVDKFPTAFSEVSRELLKRETVFLIITGDFDL